MSFIDDYLAEHVGALLTEHAPDDGHLVPPMLREDIKLSVTKMTGYLAVPDELLMDCGVIPDTRPRLPLAPYLRIPWRTKLRWRVKLAAGNARMAIASRAYRLISGEDVPEPEDW